MALRTCSLAIFHHRCDSVPVDVRCVVRAWLQKRTRYFKTSDFFPHYADLSFCAEVLANAVRLLMSWSLWGGLATIVGLVWIYKGEIDVGIEGQPPFFRISGTVARSLGALLVVFGLYLAIFG